MYDDKIAYNNTFIQHKDAITNLTVKNEQMQQEMTNQKVSFFLINYYIFLFIN